MVEIDDGARRFKAKIIVAGVGGAGNRAINRMIEDGVGGVEFLGINTDRGDLSSCKCRQLQIGEALTQGRGAGSNPSVGRKAAEDDYEQIKDSIKEADMVIITCGMGGGTGTGAAPIVAKAAKEQGILTIGVMTKPFGFEGKTKMQYALQGIEKMRENADTLIIIPNDKLLKVIEKRTSLPEALKKADEALRNTVQRITELVSVTFDINLDFADLRTVIKGKGMAHIGIGTASGDGKVVEAVKMAVNNQLLDTTVEGASGVIMCVSGDVDLIDVSEAADYVNGLTGPEVNFIFGSRYDPEMEDSCSVTIIATGIESGKTPNMPLRFLIKAL